MCESNLNTYITVAYHCLYSHPKDLCLLSLMARNNSATSMRNPRKGLDCRTV